MPSIRISEEEEKKIKRDQYGGVGDKVRRWIDISPFHLQLTNSIMISPILEVLQSSIHLVYHHQCGNIWLHITELNR